MLGNVNVEIRRKVFDMMKEDRYEAYVHDVPGSDVVVEDSAVVVCYYGNDEARLDSTKKALGLFKSYKAKAREMVFVESQLDEADAEVRDAAEDAGFAYYFVKADPDSEGLYIREALMNFGARRTSAEKIVFLDSDIGFCNPYWLQNVSLTLDGCDMTQPFGSVYFARNGGFEPMRRQIEPSAAKAYVRNGDRKLISNTGLGFAFRRWVFDAIGGFDVVSSPSDDLWMWSKFLPLDEARIPQLPYAWPIDGYINRQCTKAKIGSCDETCFHLEHGGSSSRRYSAYVYACLRQSVFPLWDVDYDPASDAMPKWADDGVWTRLRKDVIKRISRLGDDETDTSAKAKAAARRVIDEANFAEFGEIPAGRRLRVVTVLTERNTPEDVVLHRDCVVKNFKQDVEYVCLSDRPIPGVKTVRPTVRNAVLRQLDVFRKEVSGGGVCLYMSLGAVPIDKIKICAVPDGFFGASNPRHSQITVGKWRIFDDDVMLFSGDFQFVYDQYASGAGFDQDKMFISSSQCIAYNLYRRGVRIRNVCQFLDAQTIMFNGYSSYAEYVQRIGDVSRKNEMRMAHVVTGHMFGRKKPSA